MSTTSIFDRQRERLNLYETSTAKSNWIEDVKDSLDMMFPPKHCHIFDKRRFVPVRFKKNPTKLLDSLSAADTPLRKTASRQWASLAEGIFVITLREREDRRAETIGELARCGALDIQMPHSSRVRFYIADRPGGGKNGTYGCYQSHQAVANRAVEEGWNRYIVFEDDAVVNCNFSAGALASVEEAFQRTDIKLVGVEEALKRPLLLPVNFVGLGYVPFSLSDWGPYHMGERLGVWHADSMFGTHAYVASRHFAERLLETTPGTELESGVDYRVCYTSKADRICPGIYAKFPPMFDQRADGSDIGAMTPFLSFLIKIGDAVGFRSVLENTAKKSTRSAIFGTIALVIVLFMLFGAVIVMFKRNRELQRRRDRQDG